MSGRQYLSYDERILLDMKYIETRSWSNDLLILVEALKVFLVHTAI